MDKFIGFICCLLYPSLPFIGSSKCRTVPQGFLWNVSVLTARGENHAAANLNSEANINTANTDGSLQVETKLIGSITMKTAASLCFANILLGQTEFSTDRATLGYILVFLANSQLTIHWHTCGSCTWTRLCCWENSLHQEQPENSFFSQCHFVFLL